MSDAPWIRVIDEDEATGTLEEVYRAVSGKRGKIANIMKVHSLNPPSMQAHMELYLTLLFGRSKLPRATRELIAVAVSAANGCDYCVRHHAEALNHYWKDEDRTRRAATDYRTADLGEKEVALLDYAVKLTRQPSRMVRADVQALRDAGFSDDEILDANLITNYFNFVNRIALGLGVEDTEDEVAGYSY